jgi:hypothetical protein
MEVPRTIDDGHHANGGDDREQALHLSSLPTRTRTRRTPDLPRHHAAYVLDVSCVAVAPAGCAVKALRAASPPSQSEERMTQQVLVKPLAASNPSNPLFNEIYTTGPFAGSRRLTKWQRPPAQRMPPQRPPQELIEELSREIEVLARQIQVYRDLAATFPNGTQR